MLINKSGRLLVIGRMKIHAGEPVPGITLTAGEKKSVEAFTRVGYLVETKPEAPKSTSPTATAPVKTKVQKAEAQKPAKPVEAPKSAESK